MRFPGALVAAMLLVSGSQAQAEMTADQRVRLCQPSPYDPNAAALLMLCEIQDEMDERNNRMREKIAALDREFASRAEQMRAEGKCLQQEHFDALDPSYQIGIMDLRCPD